MIEKTKRPLLELVRDVSFKKLVVCMIKNIPELVHFQFLERG